MITLSKQQKAMMELEAAKEAAWAASSGLDMNRIERQSVAIRFQRTIGPAIKGKMGSKGRHGHTAVCAGSGNGNPKAERLYKAA